MESWAVVALLVAVMLSGCGVTERSGERGPPERGMWTLPVLPR